MNIYPQLYKRDFSDALVTPALTYDVNSYSWAAVGGPQRASITAYGNVNELWELAEMLRAPVKLVSETDQAVWWGYVHELAIRVGAVEVGVSLDAMANRVAVAYSLISPADAAPAKTRATTSWATDADSQSAYGVKELLQSVSNATATQANAARDALLALYKYPSATVQSSGAQESLSATITCHGWWDTLKWKYYSQAAGMEAYTDLGNGTQNLGDAAATARVAQSFTLSSPAAWSAYSAKVRVKKIGAPADNVIVELCADSAGAPGTVLATATLAGSAMPTNLNWVEFIFASPYALALSTTYWLSVRRSGGADSTNYYQADVNTACGYASGVLRVHNGSAWVARSPDADMSFSVGGVQETTAQIAGVLATAGQFLGAAQVETASGVYTPQYRDGDATALAVAEELLKGGTTNQRRLLATVQADRTVRIYEEPARAAQVYLRSDLSLTTLLGAPVGLETCPVGVWAKLGDVIPATADVSRLADPSLIFIEQAEYLPRSNAYRPTARSTPSPWDVAGSLLKE